MLNQSSKRLQQLIRYQLKLEKKKLPKLQKTKAQHYKLHTNSSRSTISGQHQLAEAYTIKQLGHKTLPAKESTGNTQHFEAFKLLISLQTSQNSQSLRISIINLEATGPPFE